MRTEALLFENALRRVNFYLKFIGLGIDAEDSNRTTMERLRNHWFYCINFLWLNTDFIGGILWLVYGIINGSSSILEKTYALPCVTLCLLGVCKSLCMISYSQHVNELIHSLRTLEANKQSLNLKKMVAKKRYSFLTTTNGFIVFFTGFGIVAFAIGPLAIIASIYFSSGSINLKLPFLVWYPFDAFDPHFWPFVYVHQIWSACVAGTSVFGPDCFYYTCCTFIHIQFTYLQNDLQRIVTKNGNNCKTGTTGTFNSEFIELVNRHRELFQCVNLLEIIFSKSTLINVITSSLLICVNGFNILAIDDLPLMVPFTSFLLLGLLQIYLICFYADNILESGSNVSYGIYNSKWYISSAAHMKDFLFLMKRAQKPCKLTAYGFSVINLRTFARILSTAWSYFALLITIYKR